MYETKTFEGVVATGDSTAMEIPGLTDKWVVLRGLSAGTVNVQISYDGTNWLTVATRTATSDWVELPQPATHVRLNTSGVTIAAAVLRAFNPATG